MLSKNKIIYILLLIVVTHAKSERKVNIEIIDFGIYEEIKPSDTVFNKDLPADGYIKVNGVKLINQTDTVKMKENLRFGIRYKFVSNKKMKPDTVIFQQGFICPGIKDPTRADTMFFAEVWTGEFINKESGTFYTLSKPWEMVKGKWNLFVKKDGKKIVSKDFYLTH